MMGWHLLQILLIFFVLQKIYASKESSPVRKVKERPNILHVSLDYVVSPLRQELKEVSSIAHNPLSPYPQSSESFPVISPVPHEVKVPSGVMHAPSATPVVHPVPFVAKPPESSSLTSPSPHESKGHSGIRHAPLASRNYSLEFSPAISPGAQEVKEPSNITHAPSAISPVPQEVKNPSNYTRPPQASHPSPLTSSPVISPAQHESENRNVPHAPLPSRPYSPKASPAMSPVQHEGRNVSNSSVAPSASLVHSPSSLPVVPTPRSSESSPVTSHAPHELQFPNATHPPAISPAMRRVNNPSNGAHAPLVSHPLPNATHASAISPAIHEVNNPSNGAHAPLVSHPLPNATHPPAISPAMHEVNNPSNGSHAPLASHPLPSGMTIRSPSFAPTVSIHQNPKIPPMRHKATPPSGRIIHRPSSAPTVSIPHHDTRLKIGKHAPAASHPASPSYNAHTPLPSHPSPGRIQSPSSAPIISTPQGPQHITRIRRGSPASAPLPSLSPPVYHPGRAISPTPPPTAIPNTKTSHLAPPPYIKGPLSPDHFPSHPPEVSPENRQRHAPSPTNQVPTLSPIHPPFPSIGREVAHPSSSPPVLPSPLYNWPSPSPSESSSKKQRAPFPSPLWALPPPPPNLNCKSLTCVDPLTYPPSGSSCVCVLPIKVGLRLRVALYTFFPLVSEIAKEIAGGISMNQSQVRIMGANADNEDPEKTIVLIYLVPFGRPFDINTALMVYQRFFSKQIPISASYFGDYDVLYVTYPGLPPSPPAASGNYDGEAGAFSNGNAGNIRPLGVDVTKKKERLSRSLIAIIVLSSVIALVLSIGAAWLLLVKCRGRTSLPAPTSQILVPPLAKLSGTGSLISKPNSAASDSFSSSIAAYTGSAKTFSLAEMERATDHFHESRIIGEGGFGRVYNGTLNDGTMVAIKVLKRDDRQGGREFLAEVEMLSRLHHRNLVKLIGICTEENARCLVYELIPNGSVESHLHGPNKESAPLDWNTRTKIALGAARGLAYLHEDSSPRVIHRDFKSSNILLEHDFTPKVSDFGLARTALDEGNQHISTQVMGTFGYVAPEYAMTGHLLVKSDVYSYGVVLLELLTGRKPVDMSQPPGQENLVSWARPLLTNIDDLQAIIDPALGTDIPYDSIAKVAAIASLCVQPEVSHRPFMGEVVQALKLVCNESDEHRLESGSECESSIRGPDIRINTEERVLSESDIFCTSARFTTDASGSFRRYSSSGPVATGRSAMVWQRAKGLSSGSMNDAVAAQRFGAGFEGSEHWP